MNDNLNEKDVNPAPEGESISLEELESRLLGLMDELEEIKTREDEALTLRAVDGEEALRVDAINNPDEGKSSVIENDFKGLDGEKAVTDEDFEFKIEGYALEIDDEDASFNGEHEMGESKEEFIEDIDLLMAAARLVVEERVATTSFIQRHFGIGYGRAIRIIYKLEELAIISPMDGNNPRRVMVSPEKLEKILASL